MPTHHDRMYGAARMPMLDSSDWDQLLDGLARGEYSLLLGAGASMEAGDRQGNHLPGARRLAQELVEDFGLPSSSGSIPLSRAYERAKRRNDRLGRGIAKYLYDRFTGCTPPSWYEVLCSVRWARIWSLNIDDVVEQAYEAYSRTSRQRLIPVSWDSNFAEPDDRRKQVVLVHLHGRAVDPSINRDPNLVFDIAEYFHAVERHHAWHHILAENFTQDPFIIVGATLSEEYDLAEILRRGNRSQQVTSRPSIIVLPEFDELAREEFEEWGLLPVAAPAGEFFAKVVKALPAVERRLAPTLEPGGLSPLALAFLGQFDPLTLDRDLKEDPRHDLYAGHEPVWSDIVHKRDARFEIVGRVRRRIEQLNGEPRLVCITGPPFSGKSVVLLRIAREVLEMGFDAFLFRAERRLDVDAVLWWVDRRKRTVLIFDELADSAPELGDLLARAKANKLPVLCIGTERTSRKREILSYVAPQFLENKGSLQLGQLSDRDIRSLLWTLEQAGRLGKIGQRKAIDRFRYFAVESQRHLFTGMAQLEGGRGFRARLADEYAAIKDASLRQAYALSCIAYSLGYALPASILASTAGLRVDRLISALSPTGPLSDLMSFSRGYLRPRHRRFASMIVDEILTREQRRSWTIDLAKQLSPYITPQAIGQRTIPYRIARRLMDHQVLTSWIGLDGIDHWYEELRELFSWNARYWEQRALANTRLRQFDRAESYAVQAVTIHPDPFTHNTLGTVLMRKAVGWATPGSNAQSDLYWRAVKELKTSRELSGDRHEHPFVTFFSWTTEYCEQQRSIGGTIGDDIVREWNRWFKAAGQAVPFQHSELAAQLNKFQSDWLKLNVS
jgi:hypothetical protein